ncbi:hypothetical protein P7H12_00840 [Paenibacillus larvae]|nr:hypothetical protein [Paenibacillus larvae]MDT2262498.1 hypothetical protein [Paenibacillus larvae]
MKDQNHKISRQIVDTAIQENVSMNQAENDWRIFARRQEQAAKT